MKICKSLIILGTLVVLLLIVVSTTHKTVIDYWVTRDFVTWDKSETRIYQNDISDSISSRLRSGSRAPIAKDSKFDDADISNIRWRISQLTGNDLKNIKREVICRETPSCEETMSGKEVVWIIKDEFVPEEGKPDRYSAYDINGMRIKDWKSDE